jgi:hypothetical protein
MVLIKLYAQMASDHGDTPVAAERIPWLLWVRPFLKDVLHED